MFRTRMSDFGHNYKAGRTKIFCPLCELHEDKQTLLLECPEIKTELINKFGPDVPATLEDIFKENIKKMTVDIIRHAMETRKKKIQDTNKTKM